MSLKLYGQKVETAACLLACLLGLISTSSVKAEKLFYEFLDPKFTDPNTEYSQWDVFGTSGTSFYNIAKAPDRIGPSSPPTITQTTPGAFIGSNNGNWGDNNDNAGPPFGGNIYSFSSNLSFVLNDTTSFASNTVMFQYQTGGNRVDLSTVRLVINGQTFYATGNNAEYIREYAGAASSFGGLDNRTAIQWDLTGLNLTGPTTYQILFDAPVHTSFQRAFLDTSATHSEAVPAGRTWLQGGGTNLSWSTSGNWQGNLVPTAAGGNIEFLNTTSAEIALGANREVGELIFDGANVTLKGTETLTVNTGITVKDPGVYTVNSAYRIGATNLMDIGAGATMRINGEIGGMFGGIVKTGGGLLDLTSNNTFNSSNPGALSSLEIYDGTLRLGGANLYSGVTTVLYGRLVLAANALQGSGALGTSSTNVSLGAGANFAGGANTVAGIYAEGDRTVGRNITLSDNQTQKTIGAMQTTAGATYTGAISLGSSSNAIFSAEGANDRVTFSGNINGGSTAAAGGQTTAVTIGGQGTVVFSGNTKTYTGNTRVASGAELRLSTTLAGSGNLILEGALSGTGLVKRNVFVNTGGIIAPGNSVGRLTIGEATAPQTLTFGLGGTYQWEMTDGSAAAGTGFDHLQVYGQLAITAGPADPFTIALNALASATFNPMQDRDWVILSTSAGVSGFSANAFDIDTSAFAKNIMGNFSLLTQNNNLVLRYVHVVPEPTQAGLLLMGLTLAALRRRRRRRAILV